MMERRVSFALTSGLQWPQRRLRPVTSLVELPTASSSKNGMLVAAGARDGVIRLWRDDGDGAQAPQLVEGSSLVWHSHWVTALEALGTTGGGVTTSGSSSDDNVGVGVQQLLVSASQDTSCAVWTIPTDLALAGTEPLCPVSVLHGHTDYVKCLTSMGKNDGAAGDSASASVRVVSGGLDGRAILWDLSRPEMPVSRMLASPHLRAELGEPESNSLYALSSYGGHVLLGGAASGDALLWDIRQQTSLPTLHLSGHRDAVKCVTALTEQPGSSHDLSTLKILTGSSDGFVRVWDIRSLRSALCSLSLPDFHSKVAIAYHEAAAPGSADVSGGGLWNLKITGTGSHRTLWTSGKSGLVVATPLRTLHSLSTEMSGEDTGEPDELTDGSFAVSQSRVVFDANSIKKSTPAPNTSTQNNSSKPSILSILPKVDPASVREGKDASLAAKCWVALSDGSLHVVSSFGAEMLEAAETGIERFKVLPDNRHVLTAARDHVQLWDICAASEVPLTRLVEASSTPASFDHVLELAQAKFLEQGESRTHVFPLQWFSVDTAFGILRIALTFPRCFAGDLYETAFPSSDTSLVQDSSEGTESPNPEARITLGESLLHGMFRHWIPTVPADATASDSLSKKRRKVKPFTIPDDVCVWLENEAGAPLHVTDVGHMGDRLDGPNSAAICELAMPVWVNECLLRGALPDPPSSAIIPFSLIRFNASKHDKPVTLNGQRLLKVARLQKHARDKIFDREDRRQARDEAKQMQMQTGTDLDHVEPEIEITVFCDGHPLPSGMELGRVVELYWKRSGELLLHWKWNVAIPPVVSEPAI